MRTKILHSLLIIAASLCLGAPASFACSTPPTYPISESWPPASVVGVIANNVPSGPVSTAMNNWNAAFSAGSCAPILSGGSSNVEINMNYAPIPPPSNCPSGATCVTRGLTNLTGFANGRLSSAQTTINDVVTAAAAITEVVAHEFGHTFALLDCNYPGCPVGSSVMESGAPLSSVNGTIGQQGPTSCDISAVLSVATDYNCPPPPPPCEPVGNPPYGSEGACWSWDTNSCSWVQVTCNSSPILIDISGSGFQLTSAAGGVSYDISGNGVLVQIAWTAAGAQDAFLCLPDAYGNCNSGKQLFGNFTTQPKSSTPNGFAALAVYDSPANGGNGDGVIDARDAIFSTLRLWIDVNHDGATQPNELFTLPQLGVTSISLNYKWDQRADQYGNVFRYRAQVGSTSGAGRMAYDVFFVTQPGASGMTKDIPKTCPPGKAVVQAKKAVGR